VPVARHELAQFAADVGARREKVEAVRLAASEAVTSIVLHVEDPAAGRVRVDADATGTALEVQVAEDAVGLRPRFDVPGLGLGLALIAHASDQFDVVKRAGGRTELRMRFGLDGRG
jgi:anti-sigma regulatory factor (Ser/Thr protein kinase)